MGVGARIGLPRSVDICGQNLKIEKLRIECSGQYYTNIGVYIGVNDFLAWLFMILIIELPFAFMQIFKKNDFLALNTKFTGFHTL